MSSYWTRSYTHHLETTVNARADDFVALLHNPRRYLELSDYLITETLEEDKSHKGLFRVDEKLDMLLVKRTPLVIQHKPLTDGARWLVQASLGVTVDSVVKVSALGDEQQQSLAALPPQRSKITEDVTISAPLPSFWLSRPTMIQRHEELFRDMDAFVRKAGIETR